MINNHCMPHDVLRVRNDDGQHFNYWQPNVFMSGDIALMSLLLIFKICHTLL